MNINDAGTVGSISRNVFFQALEKSDTYPSSVEARCSSMVKAFAHGAMGRRIDRS